MILIFIYDGYTVSEDFYKKIRSRVEEIIPAMLPGVKYTLEMLCGDEFWRPLSDGDKRLAGRCMAHMVNRELLPCRFAETKHEYPKRYQLH